MLVHCGPHCEGVETKVVMEKHGFSVESVTRMSQLDVYVSYFCLLILSKTIEAKKRFDL
jgi:hypothetical protein